MMVGRQAGETPHTGNSGVEREIVFSNVSWVIEFLPKGGYSYREELALSGENFLL